MKTGEFKSPAGLIRAELEVEKGRIDSLRLFGDFFIYPEERLTELERYLENTELEKAKLMEKIRKFYEEREIETPALEPGHWAEAIRRAAEENDHG